MCTWDANMTELPPRCQLQSKPEWKLKHFPVYRAGPLALLSVDADLISGPCATCKDSLVHVRHCRWLQLLLAEWRRAATADTAPVNGPARACRASKSRKSCDSKLLGAALATPASFLICVAFSSLRNETGTLPLAVLYSPNRSEAFQNSSRSRKHSPVA